MSKPHVKSIDLSWDDSGHFVQGCLSLLTSKHPKFLNHDDVSKVIPWWGGGEVLHSATQTGLSLSLWAAHTPMHSKAEVRSILQDQYVCFSGHEELASASLQHPQTKSGHKFSVTDTFHNSLISFFEVGNASALFSTCFSFLIAYILFFSLPGRISLPFFISLCLE